MMRGFTFIFYWFIEKFLFISPSFNYSSLQNRICKVMPLFPPPQPYVFARDEPF